MSTVAVIDYGMGNLHSMAKALQQAAPGVRVLVTADAGAIAAADRVVFPGVGAIADCMRALAATGLEAAIRQAAHSKPFLGVCLGMQALLGSSEENGQTPCLGIIAGKVLKFAQPLLAADGTPLKVPHMGWNQVRQCPHPLWDGIAQGSRFYFVHSYYAEPDDARTIAATCDYPGPFACALAWRTVFAVQFHPEKSQAAGLRLLANFLRWDGKA